MALPKPARTLAACLLVLGGAVACSGADSAPADAPNEPVDQAEHVAPETPNASPKSPKERAPRAVRSALGRLDACALIEPRGAGVRGFPVSSEVEARSPHTCRVTNRDYDEVRITLGAELPRSERATGRPMSVGGAKAYLVPGTDPAESCDVALPVSPTHIIEVHVSSVSADTRACGTARGFATSAARRLENSHTLALPAGSVRWTACDLLRPAVRVKRSTELRTGWGTATGVDHCGLWKKSAGRIGKTTVQPVDPVFSLSMDYVPPAKDWNDRDFGTVAGRELNGYRSAGDCVLGWNEWKPPAVIAPGRVARLTVSAPSCMQAERLVIDITAAIDGSRVPRPPSPQQPLLYDAPPRDLCGNPGSNPYANPSKCTNLAGGTNALA